MNLLLTLTRVYIHPEDCSIINYHNTYFRVEDFSRSGCVYRTNWMIELKHPKKLYDYIIDEIGVQYFLNGH